MPPPPPLPSLSTADKRELAALPGKATGSPQSVCGLQTFFGRDSVAPESRSPCGPYRLRHCLRPPGIPTSLSFLYCFHMFDRHRAHNNLFPVGTCTICLADPANSFNPLSVCLVFTAAAHQHHLINATFLLSPLPVHCLILTLPIS